jgi:hypothetical protein
MKNYNLETLKEEFFQHAVISEELQKFNREKYKISYPDDEIPEYLLETFNLSEALCLMCKEILELKNDKQKT